MAEETSRVHADPQYYWTMTPRRHFRQSGRFGLGRAHVVQLGEGAASRQTARR